MEEYNPEWTEMSDILTASVANVEFEGISVYKSYSNIHCMFMILPHCLGKGVILQTVKDPSV